MKTKILTLTLLTIIGLAVSAQTTAFTYQGRLNAGATAANGSYDLTFAVYDANVSGNKIAGPITNSAVAVSNGLFTVTLDFGAGVFTGTNYWVEMAVSPAGANTFATLVPRQQLTPAPYALSLVSPQATALNPAGAIIAFGGTNVPNGYLLCDGSAVSRVTYANLFAAIGTAWGSGDGSTTFNLPMTRGVFLRGVDGGQGQDPDTTSRTVLNAGGNSGDAVGSYQADQFAAHNHIEGSSEGVGDPREIYGRVQTGGSIWGDNQYSAMNTAHAYTSTAGGNETRPRNVYVNYIIKY
jgi:microcystin-dependent protein